MSDVTADRRSAKMLGTRDAGRVCERRQFLSSRSPLLYLAGDELSQTSELSPKLRRILRQRFTRELWHDRGEHRLEQRQVHPPAPLVLQRRDVVGFVPSCH